MHFFYHEKLWGLFRTKLGDVAGCKATWRTNTWRKCCVGAWGWRVAAGAEMDLGNNMLAGEVSSPWIMCRTRRPDTAYCGQCGIF